MQYIQHDEFMASVRQLYQKGGRYQKAAKDVQAAWGRAHSQKEPPLNEVFEGMSLTNHGESRINHCRKYDLNGFARLVTLVDNDICVFLFTGDHESTDTWLDKNKGLKFIASKVDEKIRVNPVFVSNTQTGQVISSESDLSLGTLIQRLPERYQKRLLDDLPQDIIDEILAVESITDEDEILSIAQLCNHPAQADVVLDVLLSLREGNELQAKLRIDLYSDVAKSISELNEHEVEKIISSDSTVLVKDVDPELFRHFVETASFQKWMLYLHPSQRGIVSRDFTGPSRLLGVSGSGKTCVLIHRALRLAEQNPEAKIAILTLNSSLAKLIDDLIIAARGQARPKNLTVTSVWKLCYDNLLIHEKDKRDYYTQNTIVKNPFATSEHIDEIWDEYYNCERNNDDADVMFEVHRTLLARGIYPKDYLKQEIDFLRSAFAPNDRIHYLDMERSGRATPLERRYREMILKGLEGWERKMAAVGAIDDIGIVTALHRHLNSLQPIYDHVLVDEVQDLGTLELQIVRKLTHEGSNDLFLCGDSAQTVHTKYCDLGRSGIDATGRYIRLNQNYRNSRQILGAAYAVLTTALENIPSSISGLEILSPEYANFSSPSPLLLEADSLIGELSMAIGYANEKHDNDHNQHKYCIAICGYPQKAIELLGNLLSLPLLSGDTDLSTGWLFLSDLEQTKGFEFDLMIVLNCSEGIIPHPNLPDLEAFRDLTKLYVALTRAKTELIVSYTRKPSRFISRAQEHFNQSKWIDYASPSENKITEFPVPSIPKLGSEKVWESYGKELLRLRDMVGLSPTIQDELLTHVSGTQKVTGSSTMRRTIEWKNFGHFYKDMHNPRARNQVISDEAWLELNSHINVVISPDIQQE